MTRSIPFLILSGHMKLQPADDSLSLAQRLETPITHNTHYIFIIIIHIDEIYCTPFLDEEAVETASAIV